MLTSFPEPPECLSTHQGFDPQPISFALLPGYVDKDIQALYDYNHYQRFARHRALKDPTTERFDYDVCLPNSQYPSMILSATAADLRFKQGMEVQARLGSFWQLLIEKNKANSALGRLQTSPQVGSHVSGPRT